MNGKELEIEHWKDIAGYEGLYQVSDMGSVRSFARTTTKGGILKQMTVGVYLAINLSKDGTEKMYSVHRLVAEAFIPNPDKLPQVNHKLGIQTDNRASELEWCTASYNQRHRFKVLNHVPHNRKLSRHEAIEIFKANKYHRFRIDLAAKFNVSVDVIGSIRRGKNYRNFTKQIES